jgi:hypothetical protein
MATPAFPHHPLRVRDLNHIPTVCRQIESIDSPFVQQDYVDKSITFFSVENPAY